MPRRPTDSTATVYHVQSRTDQTKRYAVTINADGSRTCSCPAGSFSRTCWHVGAAAAEPIRVPCRRCGRLVRLARPCWRCNVETPPRLAGHPEAAAATVRAAWAVR